MFDTTPTLAPLRRAGAACALVLALACAATAQAGVTLPTPGVMAVSGLPSQVPAGHTFTLREVMPLAVWSGRVRLQRLTPSGAWRTLATAPISPRVFWLHWRVSARLAGTSLTVRFVVLSSSVTLASSPSYTIAVTGSAS